MAHREVQLVKIIAAADGSALGNPGPAGWGWYVDQDHWACGGWPHGTNNMGELMAVLDLLQQTADLDADLHVLCDSKYVIDSVTKWMPGWKRNGWKKKDKKPVLNLELMQGIDAAMRPNVTFEWVKGHAGHRLNEEADRLANGAAVAFQKGRVPEAGPGFGGGAGSGFEGDSVPTSTAEDQGLFASPSSTGGMLTAVADVDLDEITREVNSPDPRTAVVASERALLHPVVRADADRVAALLHPDWAEVGASGRARTRAELLADVAALPEETSLEVLDVQRVDQGTVHLFWRSGSDSGTALRSSLWVWHGSRWVQRFQQGTPES